jgi:hypothetical protein
MQACDEKKREFLREIELLDKLNSEYSKELKVASSLDKRTSEAVKRPAPDSAASSPAKKAKTVVNSTVLVAEQKKLADDLVAEGKKLAAMSNIDRAVAGAKKMEEDTAGDTPDTTAGNPSTNPVKARITRGSHPQVSVELLQKLELSACNRSRPRPTGEVHSHESGGEDDATGSKKASKKKQEKKGEKAAIEEEVQETAEDDALFRDQLAECAGWKDAEWVVEAPDMDESLVGSWIVKTFREMDDDGHGGEHFVTRQHVFKITQHHDKPKRGGYNYETMYMTGDGAGNDKCDQLLDTKTYALATATGVQLDTEGAWVLVQEQYQQ